MPRHPHSQRLALAGVCSGIIALASSSIVTGP
jgi:hypothetical protein